VHFEGWDSVGVGVGDEDGGGGAEFFDDDG